MSTWSVRSRRRARQRLPRQRLETGSGDQARGRSGGVRPRARADERGDLNTRLDKLQDAVNTASGHARNVYVTFLLFGLYLAIIFGSTTHEQLLRESPVTLPLLNVGLPLFGFYWIAPALFVLLHLNLLLELYLLSGKLHRFRRALRSAVAHGHLDRRRADERRAQLYPFPFTQMLLGRQHGRLMRFLLWLVVWLTVLVLPVMLLLMGQVRFLPYHDAWTTMWQRFLVAADLLLILIFWRAIRHPADRLLSHPGRWLWHQAKVLSLGTPALLVSFLVLTFPGAYATWDAAPSAKEDHAPSAEQDARNFGDSMEEALLEPDGWLSWAYPNDWRVDRTPEVSFPHEPLIFWPTQVLFESLPFLDRNLAVREVNLVTSWPTQNQIDQFGEGLAWQNFGAPPNLRDRDLRYADLGSSIFVRGDFRGANLQGASFDSANLQGADFRFAHFQGASLFLATLQGAVFQNANLQGASLFGANLQGADLRLAHLPGADLGAADLRSASIDSANLRGADLSFALLQGTYLESGLEGASLNSANLQGADLKDANLQRADLRGANLQGANLSGAHLWRTLLDADEDLSNRWVMADLRHVDVNPIEDLDPWIDRQIADIDDDVIRGRVGRALREALRDDDRPDVPAFPVAWKSTPGVMFERDERLPLALDWGARRWDTLEDYDESLGSFLGGLACGKEATAHLARGLAGHALNDDERPYTRLLAARLIGDDCPPAADLPDDLRNQLKDLVVQPGSEGDESMGPS